MQETMQSSFKMELSMTTFGKTLLAMSVLFISTCPDVSIVSTAYAQEAIPSMLCTADGSITGEIEKVYTRRISSRDRKVLPSKQVTQLNSTLSRARTSARTAYPTKEEARRYRSPQLSSINCNLEERTDKKGKLQVTKCRINFCRSPR